MKHSTTDEAKLIPALAKDDEGFPALLEHPDENVAAARDRLFVVPHGCAFDGLASTWGLAYARAARSGCIQ